jgi:hypothetical protein
MRASELAQQIIDDPTNVFTFEHIWRQRGDSYSIEVHFMVWKAVHARICAIEERDQLAELAASEISNSGYMEVLMRQFGPVNPSLGSNCLQAGAILATVQAMFELLLTPGLSIQELDALLAQH